MAQVKTYNRDGTESLRTVKIGDTVGFKSDFEQYGKIIAIAGDRLTLENPNGFGGEYLRYATQTTERASDCWID
jgi:hypothetical protein